MLLHSRDMCFVFFCSNHLQPLQLLVGVLTFRLGTTVTSICNVFNPDYILLNLQLAVFASDVMKECALWQLI